MNTNINHYLKYQEYLEDYKQTSWLVKEKVISRQEFKEDIILSSIDRGFANELTIASVERFLNNILPTGNTDVLTRSLDRSIN